MLERYSFIPVFTCLLGGLAWWSTQVGPTVPGNAISQNIEKNSASQNAIRRDLVEALDKMISYERYYHSVYGRFTKTLARIGFKIPRSVASVYDIRVTDASKDRLLVSAVSEVDGKVSDLISINQDFEIQANFELPAPRVVYLKALALKHMRALKEAQPGYGVEEQGVFKGYFHYSLESESPNHKLVTARGIRAPVTGVRMELNDRNIFGGSGDLEMELAFLAGPDDVWQNESHNEENLVATQQNQRTGEKISTDQSLEEQAFLAQRIFRGEVGRYAKTWSELAKIAHFQFEGKERFGSDDHVLLVDAPKTKHKIDRKISSTVNRPSNKVSIRTAGGLEIEPVSDDN